MHYCYSILRVSTVVVLILLTLLGWMHYLIADCGTKVCYPFFEDESYKVYDTLTEFLSDNTKEKLGAEVVWRYLTQ